MFSGIQEILVLVIIILGILILPRIMNRGSEKKTAETIPAFELSGKMRLVIAASVLWPVVVAAFMHPWKKDIIPFLYFGFGPVAIIWIIYWVLTGFRKR
jgi:predicted Na+-dependent transporter